MQILDPFEASAQLRRPPPRRALIQTLAALAVAAAASAPMRTAWADPYRELFEAIARDDADTVRLLMLRGVGTNSPDPKLGPALVYAAAQKSFACVRALLESPLTNPNVANRAGETALMHAAMHGDLPTVRLLVSKGAQVNQPGWAPLHFAAMGGRLEVAKWLLEQHAFIDALSPNQTTPLMMAAREQHVGVARLLVQEGADPSLRNEAGLSAADYFARGGDPESARWVEAQAQEFVRRYGTRDAPVPAGQR